MEKPVCQTEDKRILQRRRKREGVTSTDGVAEDKKFTKYEGGRADGWFRAADSSGGNCSQQIGCSIEAPALRAGDSWLADHYLCIHSIEFAFLDEAPFGYNRRHE